MTKFDEFDLKLGITLGSWKREILSIQTWSRASSPHVFSTLCLTQILENKLNFKRSSLYPTCAYVHMYIGICTHPQICSAQLGSLWKLLADSPFSLNLLDSLLGEESVILNDLVRRLDGICRGKDFSWMQCSAAHNKEISSQWCSLTCRETWWKNDKIWFRNFKECQNNWHWKGRTWWR